MLQVVDRVIKVEKIVWRWRMWEEEGGMGAREEERRPIEEIRLRRIVREGRGVGRGGREVW